jgi:hypothetical protein
MMQDIYFLPSGWPKIFPDLAEKSIEVRRRARGEKKCALWKINPTDTDGLFSDRTDNDLSFLGLTWSFNGSLQLVNIRYRVTVGFRRFRL